MDTPPNEEVKLSIKGRQRWNLFQRGIRSKGGFANSDFVTSDPAELQRVSFATSIDDLPARPTAFQQVLRQIGANKNSPSGVLKMAKVPNFKKLVKDKSASPQGRHSIGSVSSSAPKNLEVSLSRPRSSSNSSFTEVPGEALKAIANASEKTTNSNDKINVMESGGKVNESSVVTTTSSSSVAPSAGPVLMEAIIQPSTAPVLGAFNQETMPGATGSYDSTDGVPAMSEQQRNKQLAEHLKQKIIKISGVIKAEQSTMDENVKEYLKLSANADKQQVLRIKSVFEKKNQKSSATIAQLQKKLDSYHRKLKETDSNGSGKQGRLRDVGANIRDFSGGVVGSVKGGLSGLHHTTKDAAAAIVNKPKDILASKFSKHRFGSADNLPALGDVSIPDFNEHYGSTECISSTSGSIENIPSLGSGGITMDDMPPNGRTSITSVPDSPTRSITRRADHQLLQNVNNELQTLRNKLEESKTIQNRLEEECELKTKEVQETCTRMLEEEKIRFEVQINDLAEMHEREISNLKQELSSMEEKVEYHAHERARDAQEALEACQTRIAKMELQQQQLVSVSVEGLQNQNAKALLGKLINLLLSILAVLLVFVSTASHILMPFMKSQGRLLASVAAIVSVVVTYRNWNILLSRYESMMGR